MPSWLVLNRLRVLTGFCKSKRPGEISKDERYLVFWNHQIPYPLTKISSLHLKMKLLPICTWLICLLLVIVCLGSECGTPRRIVRSKRDLVRIREARSTFPGPCATRLPRGKRSLPGIDRRSPRLSQAGESSPVRGGLFTLPVEETNCVWNPMQRCQGVISPWKCG